jgi:hypothetical protein
MCVIDELVSGGDGVWVLVMMMLMRWCMMVGGVMV